MESNLGAITLMETKPCKKGDGTEIIIPVKIDMKSKFQEGIKQQLLLF